MKIQELKNKRIIILGYGKEGRDNFLALRKLFPNKELAIADEREIKKIDNKTKIFCGKDYLESLKKYEVVLKTPGISSRKIKPFLEKSSKIISQTEIFFDNFPGLIIGITGTKGKGTTASLIYHILRQNNIKAQLIGNIGRPVFQKLLSAKEKDIFIYELSSHQLQNLKKSPHIAVFLNLYKDHLDYYKNINEYSESKQSICKFQTENDFFIFNKEDKTANSFAKKTKAKTIPFSLKNKRELKKIIPLKQIPLKGDFNILNVLAGLKVCQLFGISKQEIGKALKTFKGLPHRLEFVGKYKGIEFYNDSMSTIPEVTIKALESLEKTQTLILGGSDKGSDYSELAEKILKTNLKAVIFFSGTGEKIWHEITKQKQYLRGLKTTIPEMLFADSMKEAVEICFQKTKKGKICLLSPASASFNMFKDYKDRGEQFIKYVKQSA